MGEVVTIRDEISGAEACIAPHLGFNCFRFKARINGEEVEVIDSPADVLTKEQRPSGFGIPLLFPFPNRIREGVYTWDEVTYQLPLSPGRPHAIHGFCYDRPWRVVAQTPDSVTGRFQLSVDDPDRRSYWPADFILEVRYRVAENRLETQFRIENPAESPLPWGLGTHPYFKLPLSSRSSPGDCVFQVPVLQNWDLAELIPTGKRSDIAAQGTIRAGVRFGTAKFDHVFTDWQSDGGTVRCSLIDEKAGVEVSQVCDAQLFREMVVFTPPDRDAVCLEPYTCVSDAINLQQQDLDAGLQVLPPRGVAQTWLAIQVNPVLA